jgi:hypothetical protein
MTKYTFTDKGLAFAKYWSTPEAVLEQAQREIAEMECDPEDIIFHTFWLGDDYDKAFIVTPDDRGPETVMSVDVCVYEEEEALEVEPGHPFFGKKVKMPTRGSE